jgi:hypothetical protein
MQQTATFAAPNREGASAPLALCNKEMMEHTRPRTSASRTSRNWLTDRFQSPTSSTSTVRVRRLLSLDSSSSPAILNSIRGKRALAPTISG